MRYKDKLEFEINVDPSINSVHIVKLVLQPIVENAIYHGLKYKESKGMLTVNGYQKDGNAAIEIADDGVGMDEETLNRILRSIKSIIVLMVSVYTMFKDVSVCTMERNMV